MAVIPGEPRDAPVNSGAQDGRDAQFDRPVFIVSPPRSGSTLLFEALARAKDVYTIGDESHGLLENIRGLNPGDHGLASNRLDAAAATSAAGQELRARFRAALRDRGGRPPTAWPLRMLEKTPKNSLRIPFFAKVFPEARFVYLHRDARQVLASMIEGWMSGRFRTYLGLPGWRGPDWSFVLTAGWRQLSGRPLHEIVAAQWRAVMQTLLDDLAALPRERVHVARYDALTAAPAAEIARLCRAVDYVWDRPLEANLPLARTTVSRPDPEKWRRHEAEIESVLPGLRDVIARGDAFAAR
ncbi:MAG: sulfotransferase [Rudaea sp.]|uniref:sulfotransferase family protein n=1 Tax=Rudaea sp. TaxID=2136325 RepID=UPI0039E315F0